MSENHTRVWLTPGVVFGRGENGYYLEDILRKRRRRLNGIAFEIVQLCNGSTEQSISTELFQRFPDVPGLAYDVARFLQLLRREGFIIDSSPQSFVGRTPGSSFPLGVVFCELTYRCNLHCRTCFNSSGESPVAELSSTEWYTILEKIVRCNPRVAPTVLLTGGEPLVRDDFFEIASAARGLGLFVQLFTNGTLIDENVADRIAETDINYIRISLDGAGPETNDAIRGRGSFERALRAMTLLVERGQRVCWQAVISRRNFHELQMMLETAVSLGLDGFKAASIDPLGRGESEESLHLPAEKEYLLWKFNEHAIRLFQDRINIGWAADYWVGTGSIDGGSQPTDEISKDEEQLRHSLVTTSVCGVGRKSFLINPAGDIALCPLLAQPELVMGNALRDDLEEVWQNGEHFQLLRQRSLEEFDDCGRCGYRYSCLGGCRGLAYALTGRLTGCDSKRLSAHSFLADNLRL